MGTQTNFILPERFSEPEDWQWGAFKNRHGESLRFGALARNTRPLVNILFVEGLREYAEKSFELARDFNDHAFNFWVMERHGQGRNSRHLKDEFKTHSFGFTEDVRDLVDFARTVMPSDIPTVLVGHSTGGLVALMALHDRPDLFRSAVLTAPLLGHLHPILKNRDGLFARLPLPQAILESYIPGGGPWKPRECSHDGLKPADFSSDAVRGLIHDYWPERDAALRMGDPTMGWIIHSCQAAVQARRSEYLENTKNPVLIFAAGQDKLINNRYIFNAASHLPQLQMVKLPGARHDLWMEHDRYRAPLLRQTVAFIKNSL